MSNRSQGLDGTVPAVTGAIDLRTGGVAVASSFGSGVSLNMLMMQSESSYIKVGFYTGDGAASQTISVGFQPDLVMQWQNSDIESHIRTAGFAGTTSRQMDGIWAATGGIEAIGATSFSVAGAANNNTQEYHYVAMKSDVTVAGERIELESYTGNGVSGANTDTDLSAAADDLPQGALIVNTTNTGVRVPVISMIAKTNLSVAFNNTNPGDVLTYEATGLTLGTNSRVNANTELYEIIYFLGGRL